MSTFNSDLSEVLARLARPRWYFRPYTADEIAVHPDRDRLLATLEAVADEVRLLEAARTVQ